jgi:excisionase family DNA binding protein
MEAAVQGAFCHFGAEKEGGMSHAEDLIGPSEAARALGCSPQWVKQLVRRGELAGIKTSIGTVVRRRAVEQFAETREQRSSRGKRR